MFKLLAAAEDKILPFLWNGYGLKLPDSPTPHLLWSNHAPPSDSEITLIRKAIMDAEDILFEEIDDLDSRWRRDVKQRKVQKALTFISQHIRVLSPMRRLPSELLREIFVWLSPCLQIYPDSAQNWPSSKDLPWAVSQVCRSWRAIALSLPSLWNHLPLVRKTPDNQFQLDVLKELLRRTGEAPLDIYFYFSHQFEHSTHPIINLLLRHCERWQYVTVYASFATLAAFEPIKRRLPTLRALTVTTYAGRASTTFSPLQFDAFEVAPKLREVELDLNLADNHTIKLPFSQLVYYKDHSSSRLAIHELQQVLASPFLETLILCADMLGVSFSFPPIILPRLRKLRLSDCFHYSYIGFLDRITVPAIEVLEIDGNMPLATLISMISRSDTPCRLKALVVRMATTHSSGDLRALLELTPALEILDISLVSANVLYALRLHENRVIIPLLKKCRIYDTCIEESALGGIDRLKLALTQWLTPAVELSISCG